MFQKFPGEDPETPLIKGIHQLNTQNLSKTTTAAKKKKKKRPESPHPFKQSTKLKKGAERWGKIFFVCDL